MDAGTTVLALLMAVAVRADWLHRVLPNRLLVSGLAAGVLIAAVQGPQMLWLGLCGGLCGALLLFPIHALGGMAAGDVKLMGMAGVFLGVPGVFYGVLGTVLAGGLMALAWRRALPAAYRMPYAPAIAAGCATAFGLRASGMVHLPI